jgi:hypothetical protein
VGSQNLFYALAVVLLYLPMCYPAVLVRSPRGPSQPSIEFEERLRNASLFLQPIPVPSQLVYSLVATVLSSHPAADFLVIRVRVWVRVWVRVKVKIGLRVSPPFLH